MNYQIDHDFHIHSFLSSCSSDPEQTPKAILKYAKDNGFSKICLTDHLWDGDVTGPSDWYAPQDFHHVREALPLPEDDEVRFYFGCETEFDRYCRIGLAPDKFDAFDFIIIPTTHMHMEGLTIFSADYRNVKRRTELYVERFRALLNMNLPYHKIGVAHLTCSLMAGGSDVPDAWDRHFEMIESIPDSVYRELFGKAAEVGIGIELNTRMMRNTEVQQEIELRPYRIASECGCRFYFGSDAHHPEDLTDAKAEFAFLAEKLNLTEEQKFDPFNK